MWVVVADTPSVSCTDPTLLLSSSSNSACLYLVIWNNPKHTHAVASTLLCGEMQHIYTHTHIRRRKFWAFKSQTRNPLISHTHNTESGKISEIQFFWGVMLCRCGSGSICIQKYVKGEGKVAPVHTVKSIRASGGISLLIPYLNTRWRWKVVYLFSSVKQSLFLVCLTLTTGALKSFEMARTIAWTTSQKAWIFSSTRCGNRKPRSSTHYDILYQVIFLQLPATSFLLGTNIFLSTPFSDPSLRSSAHRDYRWRKGPPDLIGSC
jgi:hypothetical protein